MKKKYILSMALLSAAAACGAENTVNILMKTGETQKVNASAFDSIVFKGGNKFDMTANGSTSSFDNTVSEISFTKVDDTDLSDELTLTSYGWCEEACVTWNLIKGATSYNVYSIASNGTTTKLDKELVRNYGTYGRADALGLTPGTYSFKVVPVDANGNEISASSAVSESVAVKAFDRSGFAHLNYSGVGAYKDDGTLKEGARVVYVTKDNVNTVTCDIITDAKGGKTTGVGLGNILALKQKNADTLPLDIRIIGAITASDIDAAQLLSDEAGLQLKAKAPESVMNVTLEGVGSDACFYGFGMTFYNGTSIEMRNLAVMWHNDDAVQIKSSLHIWIHNVDIFYGQPGSDSDQAKGDGSLDIKDDSQYATLAYNHFFDSGKMSLCGMKSETGPNYIAYHHNWFDHSDSRHPRVRTMTVHVWNNYYDGCAKYGAGATMGSSIFVESNYFRNVSKPMLSSGQGTDAKGEGTFSGENGGIIKSYGNVFAEKPSTFAYVTQNDDATSFDAYEATSRNEQVPSTYKTVSGGTTYDNFDTNSSLMYSYTPDEASKVPDVVTGQFGAGRMQHGDFGWAFENANDDAYYGVDADLKSAIGSYKTSLVGIFGSTTSSGSTGDSGSTGGSTSGDNTSGGSTTETSSPISASVVCSFTTAGPSSSDFTVTGNYSDSKGSLTVGGTTYSTCLKMESSTSITFTTTSTMTLKLYFLSTDAASATIGGQTYTDTSNVLTVENLAAGTYTIKKKNSGSLYLITLE